MPTSVPPGPRSWVRVDARLRSLLVDSVLGVALAWAGWMGAAWGRPRMSDRSERGFDRPAAAFPLVPVSGWVVLALVLVAAGVAVRRVRPRVGFLLVVVGLGAYLAQAPSFGPILLAPALTVFVMATRVPLRRWLPLTLLLVPMVWAGFWTGSYHGLLEPGLYGSIFSAVAISVMPALFALVRRSRRQDEAQQREAELRRTAYEERLRVAREVHDVVGHSLSVVTMQAGVALHVLEKRRALTGADGTPAEVAASLEAIRRTSKEALAELRTTLELFRTEDQPRAPQPGLARLDDLVEALRQAGRTVTVVREPLNPGTPAPVPGAVDAAAFRILQEGLTNVVRHAGDAAATVTVRRRSTQLLLEVEDTGPRVESVTEGNGLRGMRERAAAVGGTVALEPGTRGGMVLRVDLPLEPVLS